MKKGKSLAVAILASFVLSGCAQVGELNKKLADWAGEQIKERDKYKQEVTDTLQSKRDIDTLYTRIKREFSFDTIEESMANCPDANAKMTCQWQRMAILEGGYVHEKTPGVYYRMGRSYENPDDSRQPFYAEVTLEKEGKYTLVSYKTRGSVAYAKQVQSRLLKVTK